MEKQISDNKQLREVNSVVGQMVEDGIIKQTGDKSFEAVVDPSEREQIQSKRKTMQEEEKYPNVTVR